MNEVFSTFIKVPGFKAGISKSGGMIVAKVPGGYRILRPIPGSRIYNLMRDDGKRQKITHSEIYFRTFGDENTPPPKPNY